MSSRSLWCLLAVGLLSTLGCDHPPANNQGTVVDTAAPDENPENEVIDELFNAPTGFRQLAHVDTDRCSDTGYKRIDNCYNLQNPDPPSYNHPYQGPSPKWAMTRS